MFVCVYIRCALLCRQGFGNGMINLSKSPTLKEGLFASGLFPDRTRLVGWIRDVWKRRGTLLSRHVDRLASLLHWIIYVHSESVRRRTRNWEHSTSERSQTKRPRTRLLILTAKFRVRNPKAYIATMMYKENGLMGLGTRRRNEGSLSGRGSMLQAGSLRVWDPMRMNFFNLPNPSRRIRPCGLLCL
jgi:hypothetical protein